MIKESIQFKSKKDYIKFATQNVVYNAKFWDDTIKMLDRLAALGNVVCHEHIGREQFFDGLSEMRKAVYSEYVQALSHCLTFAAFDKEAVKYSKTRFEKIFGNDGYSIMQYLDKYIQSPHGHLSAIEDEFRRQAKEKLNKKVKK